MKNTDFKKIYELWQVENLPENKFMANLKIFGDILSGDTRFYNWDFVVYGGDPVTTTFAFNKIANIVSRQSRLHFNVLYIPPRTISEIFFPWMYNDDFVEDLNKIYNFPSAGLLSGLEKIEKIAFNKILNNTSVKTTSRTMIAAPGKPCLVVLKDLKITDSSKANIFKTLDMNGMHTFGKNIKSIPKINESASLISGKTENLWMLSAGPSIKRQGVLDFTTNSKLSPIESRKHWFDNLSKLTKGV